MGQLKRIAEQMKIEVASGEKDFAKTSVMRGLHLWLGRVDERWRLLIWREYARPGRKEVEDCRKAFQVPARPQREEPIGKDHLCGVVFEWPAPIETIKQQLVLSLD